VSIVKCPKEDGLLPERLSFASFINNESVCGDKYSNIAKKPLFTASKVLFVKNGK